MRREKNNHRTSSDGMDVTSPSYTATVSSEIVLLTFGQYAGIQQS